MSPLDSNQFSRYRFIKFQFRIFMLISRIKSFWFLALNLFWGSASRAQLLAPICDQNQPTDFLISDPALAPNPSISQGFPQLAQLLNLDAGTQRFVAVWTAADGSGQGIYGKLFRVQNSSVFNETGIFLINTETLFDQQNPTVTSIFGGGFAVSWTTTIQTPEAVLNRQQRIHMRIFDDKGNALGSEVDITANETNFPHNDFRPMITALQPAFFGPGRFAIAWLRTYFPFSWSDAGGTKLPPFIASPFGPNADRVASTSYTMAMVKIIQADGLPITPNAMIANNGFPLDGTVGQVNSVSVAGLGQGRILVTWSDGGPCGAPNVRGQLLNPNGKYQGVNFVVGPYALTVSQVYPVIAALGTGGFVVAWTAQNPSTSSSNITIQLFDMNAAKVGLPFGVDASVGNSQSAAAVTPMATGGFAIAWNTLSPTGLAVYQQTFSTTGTPLDTAQLVSAAGREAATAASPTSDSVPAILALSATGQLVTTWGRNGNQILGRLYVCKRNCVLSDWTPFTACSAACNGGIKYRYRTVVLEALLGGVSCDESQMAEIFPCNEMPCSAPTDPSMIPDAGLQPGNLSSVAPFM